MTNHAAPPTPSAPAGEYPCPACRAPANLLQGCAGCGWPPDPTAAEVLRLNQELTDLRAEERRSRQALEAVRARLAWTQQRRDELAAQVRSSVAGTRRPPAPAPAPVGVPGPPTWGPPHPRAAGPTTVPAPGHRSEVSSAGVQTLLFVIGGLLLGAGAVVFTVVAWSRFGRFGQAGVLVGLTALALAAPVVARARRLPGTAETLAVLAVLLVLLDGYAAWRAGLTGALATSAWAGLVCAATALIAAGYGRLARVASPWFAALLLGQPALPLLALAPARHLPGPVYGLVAAAYLTALLAVANLVLGRWVGPDPATRWPAGGVAGPPQAAPVQGAQAQAAPGRTAQVREALRIVAWLATGGWLGTAAGAALISAVAARTLPAAVVAVGALLVVAVALYAVAHVTRSPAWATVAGIGAVVAVTLAGVRVVVLGWPGLALLGTGLVVTAVAVAAPRGPGDPTRRGRWLGALAMVGLAGAAVTVITGVGALVVVYQALTRTGASLALAGPFDWQLPVVLGLLTGAAAVLAPRARSEVAMVGPAVAALAVPPALALAWWAPVPLDLAVAAGVLVATVRAGGRRAVIGGVVAAGLVGHALLVGAATAASAAAGLWTLVLLGGLVARLAYARAPRPAGSRLAVGRGGLVAGALAWPAAVLVTLHALGAAHPWPLRGLVAATAGLLLVAWLGRRAVVGYDRFTAGLVHAVTPVALVAGLVEGDRTLIGGYAAGAALVLVGLGLIRAPGRPGRWLAARSPAALVVLLAALPQVAAVLLAPYAWLGQSWSGAPAGVGVVGGWPSGGALGLLLLIPAAGLAGRVLTGRWRPGLVAAASLAPVGLLVGLGEIGAPWPVLPAVSLLLGAALVLAVARRGAGRWAPVVAGYGLGLAGAGLAGALPTRWSTLAALTVAVGAAVAVAVTGRARPARVAGVGLAVGFALLLAIAAPRAADLPWSVAAWCGLLMAGSALAASVAGGLSRGPTRDASRGPADAARPGSSTAEQITAEVAGHAAAVVALLLALTSPPWSAGVAALWGAALGVRALRPGEPAAGRTARVVAAGGCQLLAWWLLMGYWQQSTIEAYTLPAALGAVLVGLRVRRARPELSSWLAYGPALATAAGPSLFLTLVDPSPLRRLVLGGVAVLVLVMGARWRLQAPAVFGGAVAALAGVRELVLIWQHLDTWIPLTAAGLLLVGLAATYERRTRDLAKLRAALRRMS